MDPDESGTVPVGGDGAGAGAPAGRSVRAAPKLARTGRRERSGRRVSGRAERSRDSPPGHPEDAPGDPESVARAICLRLLTGQPRTRAELATALARRGVPDDAAATVLGRFTEVGLIDDRAFAETWVESRHTGRGLARRALAAELRRRGIDDGIVGEAVAALDPETEERTAHELVRRRIRSTARLDPAVRARRLIGMLVRKGYPSGVAVRVVRAELAADGADSPELEELADLGPDGSDG